MIVVFGASSDIGRRAAARLLDDGFQLRLVARDPSSLDVRAERTVGDISGLATIAADAETVVCCAHARLVPALIEGLPDSVRQVVLIGSAWRYSDVPNPAADQVRSAESIFLASGRNGVMLHPTMIYGGWQERNLQRLVAVIRRWPVVVLPGGGRHLVQPIHVDDVAACIVAAVKRQWVGPNVVPIAGPTPMPWRDMALACVHALQRRRVMLPVPLAPAIILLELAERAGLKLPIEIDVLRRFYVDVNIPTSAMQSELGVTPRPFDRGLRHAFAEWARRNGESSILSPS